MCLNALVVVKKPCVSSSFFPFECPIVCDTVSGTLCGPLFSLMKETEDSIGRTCSGVVGGEKNMFQVSVQSDNVLFQRKASNAQHAKF